jgi:type IV pilus assembly protein PilC
MLLLLLVLIWSGVMIVVIPKFKEIFSDFSTNLPGLTVFLMTIADVWSNSPWIWIWLTLILLGVPAAMYIAVRPRRTDRPRLLSRWGDRVRWIIPGLRRIEHATGMTSIASLLHIVLGTGMSLNRAIRLVAETDMNLVLRERLLQFAELVEHGTPPPDAAAQAQLGSVTTSAFRIGSQSGQMEPALTFVADYYRSIVSRLWILIRNITWPILTLVMALLVGTFVVGMFLPLVALINSVLEAT